jgi:hypothetical protein
MNKSLSRPEALRVCKELTELELAEWSEAVRQLDENQITQSFEQQVAARIPCFPCLPR